MHALTEFSRFKHEELTPDQWRQAGRASTAYPVLLRDFVSARLPDDQIPVQPRYNRHLRAGITWSLRNIPKCHGLLVNSADVIEGSEIAFVRRLWGESVPVVPVGPLLAKDAFDPFRGTLQSEVLDLLATCGEGQALYVSFGSFISPDKAHLAVFAKALLERGQPFVWSLRDFGLLDKDYLRSVAGFGVIVPWVDQRALLAHPAVGFFVSRCVLSTLRFIASASDLQVTDMGWNSMLESLTAGKPLIGWPREPSRLPRICSADAFRAVAFDQLCNSRRIVEKYRMGFRFPPSLFFSRQAPTLQLLAGVRATLTLALDTAEGHDAKVRAAEMGRRLRGCLEHGGSAAIAKDWLVDYLRSPLTPRDLRTARTSDVKPLRAAKQAGAVGLRVQNRGADHPVAKGKPC